MTRGSAPYRFAPINPDVVEPPIAFADLDLSKPLPGGSVSGTISVTWTAKTPVCVGEQVGDNANEVAPIQIGGEYCLPGPSLRGMIRSVLEIATHSHLGRINHWRQHGVRTWEQEGMPAGRYHRPLDIHAGWLKLQRGYWFFAPSNCTRYGYRFVSFNTLETKTGVQADDWRPLEISEKYEHLNVAGCSSSHWKEDGNYSNHQADRRTRGTFATPEQEGASLGYLVCSGPSMSDGQVAHNKENEYIFGAPASAWKNPGDAIISLLHALNSDPGRNMVGQKPTGNWRFWLIQLGYLTQLGYDRKPDDSPQLGLNYPGIPVFYVGEPGQPDFFLSLSRVFRLPWRHSVGQVAQNVYERGNRPQPYRVPRLPPRDRRSDSNANNGWDFSRALFGWVEDDKHDGWKKDEGETTRALAGRVAVGFAWADNAPATVPDQLPAATGVLGAPRESFYPYYLIRKDAGPQQPNGASYDDAFAIPAGRKRYVVRETINTAALVNSEMPRRENAQHNNTPDNLSTTIHFLPAGTAFTGEIRFHNLHPVELGALLWALTFGEPDKTKRPQRHQIGRAKPQGAGALLADVKLAGVTCHPAAPANPEDGSNLNELTDDNRCEVGTYLQRFAGYMQDKGAPLDRSPGVQALLKIANTRVGAVAQCAGTLAMTRLEPPEGLRGDELRDAKNRTYPGLKKSFDGARLAHPNAAHNQLPVLPEDPGSEADDGGST